VEEVCRKILATRGEIATPRVTRSIAALAVAQHGVASRAQLRALGLKDAAIDRRVGWGGLHRIRHGVYTVGHTVLGVRGRWMAAVLACGPGAVLSHASAAALWEVRFSAARYTDVTVPSTSGRRREGLRIHRSRSFGADEVTIRHGIPVTTAARTVLDLAATLKPDHLRRLLDQVEMRELADYPALDALARAHPGHRGAAKLRHTLETYEAGTDRTKSGLERLFLKLCRDHGLPAPKVNHTVAGREVDFLFEAQRLIVETDSWRYHRTRRAFEDDRARDAIHARAGYRTLRFTDHQLETEPHSIAETVASALRGPAEKPAPDARCGDPPLRATMSA
jgi:very-short-patch-repair endonuclease